MKWFLRILMLPVAIAVVSFALANRATVAVDLWPLAYTLEVPVFALVLGSVIAGLVLGGMVSWISTADRRRKARANARELESARREAAQLRETMKRLEDDAEWQEKTGRSALAAPPSADAA